MRRRFGFAVAALAAVWIGFAEGGFNGGNNNGNGGNRVGGVAVDTEGVLRLTTVEADDRLRAIRREMMKEIPSDVAKKTELRKISLRRLEAVLAKHAQTGEPLPDEVRYLAGLQRIQYVFLHPETNDVVLAGPAEGWKLDAKGDVVGTESGRPVMFLDDLLVALRTLSGEVRQPITCSIDPTQEGMARLQAFVKAQGGRLGNNPKGTLEGIENALGPQTIRFTGVDPTSHLAQVLVAADFRMKRLAMGFEPSPLPQMPSFLQMAAKGTGDMMPRWWMAPQYEALLASPEGDAWELRGLGVKVLTEDAFFAENGERKLTGKQNPKAVQWAETMTKKYDDLSVKMPIFGELRNAMDLTVAAALIMKEDLFRKAGMEGGALLASSTPTVAFEAPTSTPTQVSSMMHGASLVITASGGVDLDPWALVEKPKEEAKLAGLAGKQRADETNSRWWWN